MALTETELRENTLGRELKLLTELPDHDPTTWHEDALCAQKPYWGTDIWFEGSRGTIPTPAEATAAEICWSCPVRKQCLKYATDTQQPHGTWGGIPLRIMKAADYDLRKLEEITKNPFDTDDVTDPYHKDNLRKGPGRPRKRKAA